jgi:hypothetical protein
MRDLSITEKAGLGAAVGNWSDWTGNTLHEMFACLNMATAKSYQLATPSLE